MEGEMRTKKFLIVLILRILETHSDKDNPLTQVEIARLISSRFPCDRKTVGRNIQFLRKIGYPIVKSPRGFYMDKQAFSREEISFVIDLVRASDNEAIDKEDLCERLFSSLSRYYKGSTR